MVVPGTLPPTDPPSPILPPTHPDIHVSASLAVSPELGEGPWPARSATWAPYGDVTRVGKEVWVKAAEAMSRPHQSSHRRAAVPLLTWEQTTGAPSPLRATETADTITAPPWPDPPTQAEAWECPQSPPPDTKWVNAPSGPLHPPCLSPGQCHSSPGSCNQLLAHLAPVRAGPEVRGHL